MASPTPAAKKSGSVHFLRTYRFRETEKDPVIDRVRTVMEDTGYSVGRVAKDSGVSYTTIAKWLDGPTRKPQYATICACVRAMGFDFAIVPTSHAVNGKGWAASAPSIIKRFRSA